MNSTNRTKFFLVDKPILINSFLQYKLLIDSDQADFLIHMGAIYQNDTRITENITLAVGSLIRCHTQPKRYQTNICWNKQFIFENENFVVLDKPAGLPCQASLDNRIENVLHLFSNEYKQKLHITHRLDVGTEGLLILAKTKSFQTEFNRLLENRYVRKIYECISSGPLIPPGKLVHWMKPTLRAPKILTSSLGEIELNERWKICELEILNSQTYFLSSDQCNINFYRLQLLTGRTHQIRAQLSFEKNPIFEDNLYGGLNLPYKIKEKYFSSNTHFEHYALRCTELQFKYNDSLFEWNVSRWPNAGDNID